MKLSRREFLSGLLKVSIIAPIVPAVVWFSRNESMEVEISELMPFHDGGVSIRCTSEYDNPYYRHDWQMCGDDCIFSCNSWQVK